MLLNHFDYSKLEIVVNREFSVMVFKTVRHLQDVLEKSYYTQDALFTSNEYKSDIRLISIAHLVEMWLEDNEAEERTDFGARIVRMYDDWCNKYIGF